MVLVSWLTDPFGSLLNVLVSGMGYIALGVAVAAVLYAAVSTIKIVRVAALVAALVAWSFGLAILGMAHGSRGADQRCEARVQKSISEAAERDRRAATEIAAMNKKFEADRLLLSQEIFKRDRQYDNERAAEEAVETPDPKPLSCVGSRRATRADDRRVWGE